MRARCIVIVTTMMVGLTLVHAQQRGGAPPAPPMTMTVAGFADGGQIQDILGLASRHRLAVVSDEVFSEFIYTVPRFPRANTIAQALRGSYRDEHLFEL